MKKIKDGNTQSGGDVSLPGGDNDTLRHGDTDTDTDTLKQDEALATEVTSNIDPHHGNGGSYVINGNTQTRQPNQ